MTRAKRKQLTNTELEKFNERRNLDDEMEKDEHQNVRDYYFERHIK